jgi:hypothetical protein
VSVAQSAAVKNNPIVKTATITFEPISLFTPHPLCAKSPGDASYLRHWLAWAILAGVNKSKSVKRTAKKETSAKCQSCPHTIDFFCHFDPDEIAKKNFENEVLVWGFFTGANKLFPLHLPVLEKLSDDAFAGNQPAVKLFVELATHLSWRISMLEKKQPKIISEIAAK